MKRSTACSISDVAKKARVSTATVSRVLNNGSVSAATRARVEKAIRETSYQPDSHAVSLRKKRTRKVGVVVPDIGNPAYSLTVKIAHDALRRDNYSLILGNTYGTLEEELQVLQMMQRERVSGIIFSVCEGEENPDTHQMLNLFREQGVHLVFLGQKIKGLEADSVSVNNEIAMQKCVRYLLRTGHKHLAYLAGGDEREAIRERRLGFMKAMESEGKSPVVMMSDGAFTLTNGEMLAERVFRKHKVDALVCGNDLMAIGAIRAARNAGLTVPDDVAITGFDDIELASLVHPPLTTVHQPFDRIVDKACRLLIGRIEGSIDAPCSDRKLEPEIIVRDSA